MQLLCAHRNVTAQAKKEESNASSSEEPNIYFQTLALKLKYHS